MTVKYETRIISFEELPDRDGRLYTVYNILVQAYDPSTLPPNVLLVSSSSTSPTPSLSLPPSSVIKSWYIRKRYKHFNHLYRSLKDRYPLVGQYKFPNKSVFHTFSKFTKERRQSGFEEFLNLVISIPTIPPEMEDFLEVDDHQIDNKDDSSSPERGDRGDEIGGGVGVAGSSSSSVRYRGSGSGSKHSSSRIEKKELKIHLLTPTPSSTFAPSSALPPTPSSSSPVRSIEESLREKLKKKIFLILMSSYISTTLCYALLIYTSLVDITSTTTDRIVLTMLSLGAAVSLFRLAKIKRERRS